MYSFWSFIKRWFFSTNHKDIGSLYMFFSAFSNNLLIVLAGSALLLLLALAFLMVYVISPKVFEALYSADNANYVMLLLGDFILPVSRFKCETEYSEYTKYLKKTETSFFVY